MFSAPVPPPGVNRLDLDQWPLLCRSAEHRARSLVKNYARLRHASGTGRGGWERVLRRLFNNARQANWSRFRPTRRAPPRPSRIGGEGVSDPVIARVLATLRPLRGR